MIISRRGFIGALIAAPLVRVPAPDARALLKKQIAQAMQEFQKQIDTSLLHGIPYHESNDSTREWLGISRA